MTDHRDRILEQFTRQAAPFAGAPAIRDEEALRRVVAQTGAGPADTVLDVACGPGIVACAFARVVRRVTGIDITPAMIDQARALARERGLDNIDWQVGDILPLPHADGSFSIVLSRFAFHHLLDPGAALAEMRRVARPGGRVAVIDVLASPDPVKAAAYNRMEKIRDPSHARALTLAELEGLFPRAGLPAPRIDFYRMECALEGVLERSFPEPGGKEEIRRIYRASIEGDGLGLSTRLSNGEIHFAYPIAILTAGNDG
jgi:SAM-dependent methyltransferase